MKSGELKYYDEIGNWDFSMIKCKKEELTDWKYFEQIRKYTNENSLCLDLGTGGGEKVLKKYPDVGFVIATDFSEVMIKTAKENQKKYNKKNVKFTTMDSNEMKFPNEMFDLVSARHTVINAKKIYDCLVKGGVLVIEGVDKNDCLDLKKMFGRGQAYNDEIAISDKDYSDIKEAGFSKIEKGEILVNEYYETKEDLLALLLKAPILDDYSEINKKDFDHIDLIDKDIFEKYVKEFTTPKGILLKRVLYGIVAIK